MSGYRHHSGYGGYGEFPDGHQHGRWDQNHDLGGRGNGQYHQPRHGYRQGDDQYHQPSCNNFADDGSHYEPQFHGFSGECFAADTHRPSQHRERYDGTIRGQYSHEWTPRRHDVAEQAFDYSNPTFHDDRYGESQQIGYFQPQSPAPHGQWDGNGQQSSAGRFDRPEWVQDGRNAARDGSHNLRQLSSQQTERQSIRGRNRRLTRQRGRGARGAGRSRWASGRAQQSDADVLDEDVEAVADTGVQLLRPESQQSSVPQPCLNVSETAASAGQVGRLDSVLDSMQHALELSGEVAQTARRIIVLSERFDQENMTINGAFLTELQESCKRVRDIPVDSESWLSEGYHPGEKKIKGLTIWSRAASKCIEIDDCWRSDIWQHAMDHLGKKMGAAAFDSSPVDYDADRYRSNAYLCQSQTLLDRYVRFRELISSAKNELHKGVISSHQRAQDVIIGTSDRQVAEAAATKFRTESERYKVSRFASLVLKEFDVKLRGAYINMWPFAEPSRPAELFIGAWSGLREVLLQAFAGCKGLEVMSRDILREELDQASREVPSPITGLSDRLVSEGVQDCNDPRIVQALTLRGDMRPEIEAEGSYSYDFIEVMKFFENWQTARASGFIHPHATEAVVSSAQQLLDTMPRQIIEHNDHDD